MFDRFFDHLAAAAFNRVECVHSVEKIPIPSLLVSRGLTVIMMFFLRGEKFNRLSSRIDKISKCNRNVIAIVHDVHKKMERRSDCCFLNAPFSEPHESPTQQISFSFPVDDLCHNLVIATIVSFTSPKIDERVFPKKQRKPIKFLR